MNAARTSTIHFLFAYLAFAVASVAATDAADSSHDGPDALTVDFGRVLNDTRRRPTGVVLDYLMDDDKNPLLSTRRSLASALQELGGKYLRYPGGWKSAVNLWSVPPFASSQPTLAGEVPEEWIRPGVRITTTNGAWAIDPLDFDEFMSVCRAAKEEPIVVTAYESYRWPATRGWRPPSRERLFETAVAWVRYANRVKGYGVKYWEIGNETWLSNETWTNGISATEYSADVVELARRMKEVDPGIQIGVNGENDAWWQVVLSRAVNQIDFLSVHSYPCWKWAGYAEYVTNSPDILASVRVASRALTEYAPAHRSRIKIMLTEFAAGSFGDWDKIPADLGRALITFDLQGQLLQCPQVQCSLFWNTHNIYSDVNGGVFDAFRRDNALSPIGRALWIWNHYLGDEMVTTVSSATVRCFATKAADGHAGLFLVNKGITARRVGLVFQRLSPNITRGEKWTLQGNGPADQNPRWERAGSVRISNARIDLTLEPVSLTVVLMKSG